MMCTSPSAAPALPSLPHHWRLELKGLVPKALSLCFIPQQGLGEEVTPRREACPGLSLLGCQQELVMPGPHHLCFSSLCPTGCCAHRCGCQPGEQTHMSHTCTSQVGAHEHVHAHVHPYPHMPPTRVYPHLCRHVHPLPSLCPLAWQSRREQAAGGRACLSPCCGSGTGRGDRKGREGIFLFSQ